MSGVAQRVDPAESLRLGRRFVHRCDGKGNGRAVGGSSSTTSRLRLAAVEEGWLVYPVAGVVLASGENLLTVKLEQGSEGISIEKVELDLG